MFKGNLKVNGTVYGKDNCVLTEEEFKLKLESIGLSYVSFEEEKRELKKKKQKPIVKKSTYAKVQEARKQGNLVNLTTIVEGLESELSKRLRKYFKENLQDYSGMYGEYTKIGIEEIIYYWQKYTDDIGLNIQISMPVTTGSNYFLIPVTKHLEVVMLVVDEYYGEGDSSTYVDVSKALITESASEKDIDRLIEVMNEYKVV